MKKLIFFICVALFSIAAKAQTSQLATLCHNGEISTFYSSKALIEAHKAAQDGDIITLSGGMFEPTTITKNVTVRGAGMMGDNPTIISGTTYISIASTTGYPTFEGINFNERLDIRNTNNPHLIKCAIKTLYLYGDVTRLNIIHCDILNLSNSGNGTTIVNSHVVFKSSYSNLTIENSIITLSGISTIAKITDSYIINCIIDDISNNTQKDIGLVASNVARGCIYIGNLNLVFNKITNNTNRIFPAETKYLKEETTTYELLDELKTTWLGTDGTQVGMHGGNRPFDPETTTPKIKKFDVSSKTSADGKLSINLEIDAD